VLALFEDPTMTISRLKKIGAPLMCAALIAGVTVQAADACTRIFSNDKGGPMLVARSMDWSASTDPHIYVMPRGLSHDGSLVHGKAVFATNPLKWTSVYGSVVTSIYGAGTADGVNEKGLAAHMLYFPPADYGARDDSRPGVQGAMWAQYALDTSATVAEALDKLAKIQVVKMSVTVGGATHSATVHLAIEDASGDSAVLEYIGGKLVVHHGREFKVMTNAPSYTEQLQLLSKRDFSHPTMETVVPGNVNPRDRFQRATYYLSVMTPPKDERAAVAGMFTLIRSVSIPFGAPVNGATFDTEYRVVSDLSHPRYYFELTTAPNVIWTDFTKLNLAPGAAVLGLDPNDVDLSGEVSAAYKTVEQPY
jgi:penicillin V acylase-like amidase (Ntn superfamily)